MRRLLAAASASLVVLAACSDTATQTESPIVPHAFDVAPPAPCPTIDQLRAMVPLLYSSATKQAQLQTTLNTLRTRMTTNKVAGARELALLTTRALLADYDASLLTGGQSTGTQANLRAFVNGLFCFTGMAQPNLTFSPDEAAGVVGPGSPTTTIVTATLYAGVQVPGGSAPDLTLIRIRRLPDAPAPLLTPLDQYPAFYEFEAFPPSTFSQDLTVGVCQADLFNPADYANLRVAHNVGAQAVILPLVTAPFLDCTTLLGAAPFYPGLKGYASSGWHWMTDMVLPTPAYATALGSCCIAGSTKSFSPFGAVDIRLWTRPGSVGRFELPAGSVVPNDELPVVRVQTPLERPVPGVTVTFALAPSSDASLTGAVQVTDAQGRARLGGWTLGADNRPDTVYATVTPLPGTTTFGPRLEFVAAIF